MCTLWIMAIDLKFHVRKKLIKKEKGQKRDLIATVSRSRVFFFLFLSFFFPFDQF